MENGLLDGPAKRKNRNYHSTTSTSPLKNNSLFQLCSPFLTVMRIGGIFFLPTTDRKRFSFAAQLSVYYSMIAFLWILAYYAKTCFNAMTIILSMDNIFKPQNLANFFSLMTYGQWFVHALVCHMIFFQASYKRSKWLDFFQMWENLRFPCQIVKHPACRSFAQDFRPRRNVIVVTGVVVLMLQVLTLWAPSLIHSEIYTSMNMVIYAGMDTYNIYATVVTFFGHFYTSCAAVTPMFIYVLIATAICGEFSHLSRDLSNSINEDGEMNGSLEWFRLRHSKLCVLLDHANGIFSFYIFVTLIVGVLQMFMLLFVAVQVGMSYGFIFVGTQCFWFVIYTLQPWLIMWSGVRITAAAHAPLDKLHLLDHSKLTVPETQLLHTFMSKLSGGRIGFSGWKLFLVDETAILSILGTYFTYQILLFQVQMDLQDKQEEANKTACVCNCTSSSDLLVKLFKPNDTANLY